MPKTYQFTEEQIAELEFAAKKNKNKIADKRLEALLLRGQGMKRAAVAEKTGFSKSHIVCDGAAWHKTNDLIIPKNIRILFLPPATPEMNPIGQIWTWMRGHGF